MSVIDQLGNKIVLPRLGPDGFWAQLAQHYAGTKSRRWKYLAMLTLHESAGWTLEQVARAFGHPRGHVSRCIARLKRELRQKFDDGRTEE
jgi:hypothetical protein